MRPYDQAAHAATTNSGAGRTDGAAVDAAPWCDRCGGQVTEGNHRGCVAARDLEPPRYCPNCRRRLKVQVLPSGWSAVCVEHGESRAVPDPGP